MRVCVRVCVRACVCVCILHIVLLESLLICYSISERASEKKKKKNHNKVFAQAGCMTGVFPLKLNTIIIIMPQLQIMHNSSSMHPVLSLGLCCSQAQSKPHTAKHRPSRFCHCILTHSGQSTTRGSLPHTGSQNNNKN